MDYQYRLEKQFIKTMQREMQTIKDYFTDNEYQVFFRKIDVNGISASKLKMFYFSENGLNKGTTFTYQGQNYVVENVARGESNLYSVSTALHCPISLNVQGVNIPCNVSDLTSIEPNETEYISTINGNICLITGDNVQSREIKLNDEYKVYGLDFEVINLFYNDNITYIYLRRIVATHNYTIEYNSNTEFDLADGSVQLEFVCKDGALVVDGQTLTYASSNISTATIDNNGLLTMLASGTTTITATWQEQNINKSIDITINQNQEPTPTEVIITGADTITKNTTQTYTSNTSVEWYIENLDETTPLYVTSSNITDTSIDITAGDYSGKYITLRATSKIDNSLSTEKYIQIKGLL